jgi:hypothetical protein
VLAVSERRHDGAGERCIAACVQLARRIQAGEAILVVDDNDEILTEYLRNLGDRHVSDLGTKIARLLRQRKHDPTVCRLISISPSSEQPGSYDEVPDAIRDFDPDDQKFFAVANADPERPQIFAGLDEEWWCRRSDLAAAGLDIQFICSEQLMDLDC